MNKSTEAFQRLLTIMDELRAQCPWDKKQTFESLSSLTIEESYELFEAIQQKDMQGIKEEVGDVLLHMVFYAKLGSEEKAFDITDIIHAVCDKLVRRHPHIYGEVNVEDEAEVKKNWERIKMQEKSKQQSVLSGVPSHLPASLKAQRMQEKAAQIGFDWPDTTGAWDKLQEELQEYHEATTQKDHDKQTEEFGDILFSLINYGRLAGIDTHYALEQTNKKFKARLQYMESAAQGKLSAMSLQEMEVLWEEAKNTGVE